MTAMAQWLEASIWLVLAGLAIILLVWAIARVLSKLQPALQSAISQPSIQSIENPDGVLLIQPGGRVDHINRMAREWFGLDQDDSPDLERLARQARPMDEFLSLCAREGQTRLTVNGRMTEAISYQVAGPYPQMLVSLRRPDLNPALSADEPGMAGSVLKIVTEFGQSIAASLNLEATLQAVLDNVARLIPADVLEVKVLSGDNAVLIPYRFSSLFDSDRRLERANPTQFGEYSDYLVQKRQPLFVPDTQTFDEVPFDANPSAFPVRSYIGIPLQAGGELVGTLEIGQAAAQAFPQEDLDLLQLIGGQAAVAIRNAVLYENEQKRTAEMTGLANLAQAAESIQDPKDLFGRLVQSVAPLFEVEILGFLTYDDDRGLLEGQVPFHGLPPHVVQIYHTTIAAESRAEEIIQSQTPIISEDASQDERWSELGLEDISQAASLHDTALIPLLSGGRFLGYMQFSNHRGGPVQFSADEQRLMNIVANQAATIIDNATLLYQSRKRAYRSEALRRIASLAASSATFDEILRFSVQELARLLQADVAAIFLLDESQGVLNVHKDSLWGEFDESLLAFERLHFDDSQFHQTVTGSKQPFLSGNLSVDQRVLPFYQPLVKALGVESAIVVPLVAREHSLGEMLVSSRERDFFDNLDLQILVTAAGQIATAIEDASLYAQTDESLRKRVNQLTALTRVSRELNITLDLNRLLQVVFDEGVRTTEADCGTIRLFDMEDGSSPDGPRVILSLGCPVGDELSKVELTAIQRGESISISDFDTDGTQPSHEGVRSALVVPIAYQGKTAGLIHLHSSQPGHFDEAAMDITQILAVQAAIALGNAHRFQDQMHRGELLRRRADTLTKLIETTTTLGPERPLTESLEEIASGIQQSTPFQVVLISIYETSSGQLHREVGVGLPPEILEELKSHSQPLTSVQQLMKPEFRISRSYYIPANETPLVPADVHMVTLNIEDVKTAPNAWDPNDFLLIPLEDTEGNPLGLISLDAPNDGLRPDLATIESVEIFAAEAALVISTYNHQYALRDRIDALSSGIQRQQQLISVSQNDLPILLRKDLEQTISIHNLERRGQRVRAGLAITESVSRQLDATSALQALGREILTQLAMSTALVAEDSPEGPRLLHVMGSVPQATNPEALFGQRNPLRACLQTGEIMLVMNLEENDEWRETSLLSSLRAKAFICLPIIVENKPIAAVMAVSPEVLPTLTEEDQQVYHQISRQTSVILQNIRLLNETRRRLQEVDLLLDFSRQLSKLDPTGIVKTLLDSARYVLPKTAHAGMVLLWDEREKLLKPYAVSGYADNDSMRLINYKSGEALPGIVFAKRQARVVDEVNFTRDYTLSAANLLHYREATGGRLPVSSLVIPVQTGERCLGILALDNFNTIAAFTAEDESLLLSLSQQVALSLENVRLVEATQERAGQLEALTDVTAVITSSLQHEELVVSLLDQLTQLVSYDTATLWLREKDRLTVAAARGFEDTEERIGLSVDVDDSVLFKEMIRTGQAIQVSDVSQDERFLALVEAKYLSWLGIPLISKSEVMGVIALEKSEANFFTREHIQVVTTFTGQAAVALENATLYEDSLNRAAELDQRSQRLTLLNRFSSDLSSLLDAEEVLRLTARELRQAVGAYQASVVVFERGQALLKYVLPEPKKLPETVLPQTPLFDYLADSLGIFTTDDALREPDLQPLAEFLGKDTKALMVLPLVSGSSLHSLIFLHMQGETRFGLTEIELTRTIGNQASIALESARLYQSTRSTAERLATLNQVSYEIGASLDPETIYAAVHQATQRLMPVESFVIALLDEENQVIEGVYLMDRDKRSENQRLELGQGISGQVINSGQPLLIHGGEETNDLAGVSFGELGTPQSILAVPMTLGGRVLGMLSVQSYQPKMYTEDDQQILSTFANQAIVAIQNARLFAETQRLAEELEERVIERTAQLEQEQRNTETLLRILTEVSASLDLDRALNRTLSLLNDAIGAEQGTVMLLYPEDNLLHYRAGYGYLSETRDENKSLTLRVGEGLAGWVVENRESAMVEDLDDDLRWVKVASNEQRHRSAVVAPLVVGEDVIGVLMVFHRKVGFFSPEQANLVRAIAGQVAVAINNANLYELIRDQAERLGSMLRREQEEASRSQAILEAVADGVLVTDSDNTISFINDSTQRILDLDVNSIMGQLLEDFGGLFGKAAGTWMQTIRTWSEDPSSYEAGDTYAEQLELDNGNVILVHLAPVMLHNDFLGTVSIFRDITHEVEVDRLKSEFVATVSHELRTPMTSIKGYVDILLMGAAGALSESQIHFLEIVRNNTERLNILVNDLLDLSRIEAGRVTLSPQSLDLREVAEDVISDVLRRAQEENKTMTLTVDAPKKLARVFGDSERVRQILHNLVDNAYHYTPENGTIVVRMRSLNGSGEVQVDVKDNGVGIASEDQDRIFERFYRGEHPLVLETPGTGLGLSIVRQLVEMHKGRIWMQSDGIGEGSTFSFTLPVHKTEK
jgi:GAF domain-containing protein/sensor histidine kinase regulating citrate/malate metabolism